MKKLTIFYLETCPYCIHAKHALKELRSEHSAYAGVEIEWIEERRQPTLANRYDYYYVPSVYDGEKKLYEANPSQDYAAIKESIRGALDAALGA